MVVFQIIRKRLTIGLYLSLSLYLSWLWYLPLGLASGIRNLPKTPRKPALLVQPTLEKLEPLGSLRRVAIKIRVFPHGRIESHGRPVDKESVEVFSPKSAREGHVLRGVIFDDGKVS